MGFLDQVRSAGPGTVVYDREEKSSVTGLELHTGRSGKKTWKLYYRTHAGVQRRQKIGGFPALTPHDARKIAKELLVRVARGEDPAAEKAASRAELTLRELWEKVKVSVWNRPDSRYCKEIPYIWRQWIEPRFGAWKLSQLTAGKVRQWIDDLRQGGASPGRINCVLVVLKRMFSWAEEREIIDKDPIRLVPKFPANKRSRFATETELRALAEVLRQEADKDPFGTAFLWCLLLTGARPSSLLRATWSQLAEVEIGGERAGLLVREGKTHEMTGEEEKIVLPLAALRVLDALPRSKTDLRIFQRAKIPGRLWQTVRTKGGCPDLRVRDLRRTFATVGFSNGVDEGVVSKLLGHTSVQTTRIYAKLKMNPLLVAAQTTTNAIALILAEKPEDGKEETPTSP